MLYLVTILYASLKLLRIFVLPPDLPAAAADEYVHNPVKEIPFNFMLEDFYQNYVIQGLWPRLL